MESKASAARQGVMSVALRDRNQIYQCYMPFLKSGGLFVPTDKSFQLGDEVFLLLTLMDDPTRYPVTGKVVWLTPKTAISGRPAGIGLQFTGMEAATVLKKIDTYLAGIVNSDRPTHTL
ncbi:PilZ domain-containing protein [Plasticicumulans acidivorans]|uniref:Type IV pilus assembly protein PilZ n=1 Tax=Plasticicumulans acidivorans TaxID=886464 RepID=A0A317MTA3_9GAMM|nr:PilZ domain-containing protein [Plasticicumulans acidivorans]PWV59548.1 type IV pilus assembly protein PilZ [Plasticicumulans acidivorans]